MLNLFMVGTIDYTNNIINGSFDVSKEDVAITWTDANLVEHQDITRTRIEGTMTMLFRSEQQYLDFIAEVERNKNREGYVLCSVKPNNGEHKTNYFKLTMRPVVEQKSSMMLQYQEFELGIRER